MGLDFSHGNAHFTYSGFGRFRKRLAREIGIDLDEMDGFGGEKRWDGIQDPIVHLLNHSDCEGCLPPDVCEVVAKRLRELASVFADEDWMKSAGMDLAKSMEEAAAQGCCLQFG